MRLALAAALSLVACAGPIGLAPPPESPAFHMFPPLPQAVVGLQLSTCIAVYDDPDPIRCCRYNGYLEGMGVKTCAVRCEVLGDPERWNQTSCIEAAKLIPDRGEPM